jgi:hypothetical protein
LYKKIENSVNLGITEIGGDAMLVKKAIQWSGFSISDGSLDPSKALNNYPDEPVQKRCAG